MRRGLIVALAACGDAPDLTGPWVLDPASVDGGRVEAVRALQTGATVPLDPATEAMARHLAFLPEDHPEAARLRRLHEPLFVVDATWAVRGSADALTVAAPGQPAWTGRLTGDRLVLTAPGGETLRVRRAP